MGVETNWSVFDRASAGLMSRSLAEKSDSLKEIRTLLETVDDDCVLASCSDEQVLTIDYPGLPANVSLVHPSKLKRRGLGSNDGRACFLHAVAHIEFNAINLALDAIYRFRGLPARFYRDWLSVALDECRHHEMLVRRMGELGFSYGDFVAHNGLWDAAMSSAYSLKVRMAIVPCVFEARGLDVTPGMIRRLQSVGDRESAAILQQILDEEIGHVAIGNRWFEFACTAEGLDPDIELARTISQHMPTRRHGEMNTEARLEAGFSAAQLRSLK
ncbi:MAG: ferritin-like domain-containing protein [Pseudomonadota bacterium]